MQVLVVEDELLIRMLVCNLLEEAGHDCVEAACASQALALIEGGICRPDILVSDFNLGPGPNGQDLARLAQHRLPGLGTVFMTGNPEAFDHYAFRPAERLLAKPFSGAALIAAVQAVGGRAGAGRAGHQAERSRAALEHA
ncbi:response regulator [Roseicella sp. DB1501]|uniref:response regulator n=1 Tax=Roseicella sp. DB1501 TaxID=2730925 RepID=UPI0014922726|nr:response regulator [Roseicella sp. DB1501]NOG71395.1 response regulator [Roseicella sp. DB1501]